MIVLGIDPGAESGWCLYHAAQKRSVRSGKFAEFDLSDEVLVAAEEADHIVVESLRKAHAGVYPTTVESAYFCGRIVERLMARFTAVHEMLRIDVKRTLTDATFGEIRAKNDSTVWQAIKMLHGGAGSDSKGKRKKGVVIEPPGPIGSVVKHERAALAVAVAWTIREGVAC